VTPTSPRPFAAGANTRDPAVLSYGFRPVFLGGAVWAALAIVLWLRQYFGELLLPTAFAPLDWHIHEMVFGYLAAIVAGFLLTATGLRIRCNQLATAEQ
jgi:uncharacterized protein involved in response to NO